MLRIDQITYRIGPRTLFDGASATVNPGHRVGFVGRNGTGKTTLLGMLSGEGSPIRAPSRFRRAGGSASPARKRPTAPKA